MRTQSNTWTKLVLIIFLIMVPIVSTNLISYSNLDNLQTAIVDIYSSRDSKQLYTYYPEENITIYKMSLIFEIQVWNPSDSKKIIVFEMSRANCYVPPFYIKTSTPNNKAGDVLFNQLDLPETINNQCIGEEQISDTKFGFNRGITHMRSEYNQEFTLQGNITGIYGLIEFEFLLSKIVTDSYKSSLLFQGNFSPIFSISPSFPSDIWGDIKMSIIVKFYIFELVIILLYLYKGKNTLTSKD